MNEASEKNLAALEVRRKTGLEPFTALGQECEFSLLDFWQWSSSDLVGNALRGVLAEYIVATAVGDSEGVRTEWDAYDVTTRSGVRVEVKSAAYLQSWEQQRLSNIQFAVRPTYGWDAKSNKQSSEKIRQADVYVFCVLAHTDKATVDPMNLDQWEFFCISTSELNQKLGDQRTMSLSTLLKLRPQKTDFSGLPQAIDFAVENDG